METKHCTLDKILDEEQARFIKNLFHLLQKNSPEGNLLANTKELSGQYCPHLFSFGYRHYCDNQCRLSEYIKDNKETYPALYKKVFPDG